jgi:hypothetical protein
MHAQHELKRFSEEEKMAWHTIAHMRTIHKIFAIAVRSPPLSRANLEPLGKIGFIQMCLMVSYFLNFGL